MSSSSAPFKQPFTQGCEYIQFPVQLLPQGTDPPTQGEGDSRQLYFVPARTDVGIYTMTTTAPWLAIVAALASVGLGTPADTSVDVGYEQNGDNTWTVTISVFTSSTGDALELDNADGDVVNVLVFFRNTETLP